MNSPEAELLRVKPDAGLDEIKRAYRKAALAHYPDQNPHPDAARHFRRLTEAYRVLEAKAGKVRKTAREVPLTDRVSFVLGDIRALVRRWPAQRWTSVVDGLPAAVWVASVLEVLAAHCPGAPAGPVVPSVEGVQEALGRWDGSPRVPASLTRAQVRSLKAAVDSAEARLRALDRPTRRPAK